MHGWLLNTYTPSPVLYVPLPSSLPLALNVLPLISRFSRSTYSGVIINVCTVNEEVICYQL